MSYNLARPKLKFIKSEITLLLCFSLKKITKNRKTAKQKKKWKNEYQLPNKTIVCIDNLEQKIRLTNNAIVSTVEKNNSTNLTWV